MTKNDILPALKGGVSPLKEKVISASIHPRNELRGFLEASNNDKNVAQKMQDEIFRKMPPERKLKMASDFYRFARNLRSANSSHGTRKTYTKHRGHSS